MDDMLNVQADNGLLAQEAGIDISNISVYLEFHSLSIV